MIDNPKYIKKIITIIILTNIAVILSLPWFWKVALSFILGSFASVINFLWLAKNIRKSLQFRATKTKLVAVKGSFLRTGALAVYSLLLLFFIELEIIFFGLGLLSIQIIVYLYEAYKNIKKSKYFRG